MPRSPDPSWARAWAAYRGPVVAHRIALFGPISAATLLAGVTGGLLLPALPGTGWLVVLLLLALALLLRGGGWRLAGVLLFGIGFAGLHADHVLGGQLPASLERRALEIQGRIAELPVHEPRRTRFEFVVDDDTSQPEALRGKRIRLGWFDEDIQARARLQAGSRWAFPVELRTPMGLRNPGASDGEKHALAARIAATGHVMEPVLARRLASPTGIAAWRERMSARIAASVPSESSRYVRALALGDTRALDETDWSRLRAAGLTHLIAISGFHVGLVAGFFAMLAAAVWWLFPGLCRWLPRPFAAGMGAILGACLYAALTGFAVPTLRTAVMIAALVTARCLRRRQRLADTLSLGCIVLLLLDPLAVLGAGFWLSFAGVAWLLWCLPADQGPRRWAMLHGFVAAQAVATLGLLPLTVLLFGQASFAGPVANLAAVPWWSLVVVPLALLGVLAETVHAGLGQWPWQAAAWCFDLLWPMLARVADSPLAMAWLPEPRWHAWPLAMLSAFWLLLPRGLPGKPLALLLWLPLLCPPRDLPAHGEAELTVIDVGQGLSVLVRTTNHSLLYDMGPATIDGFDAGARAVVPALHGLGVRRLDAAVVSHGDNDHAGGWNKVSRAFPVASLLAPEGSPVPGIVPCRAGQSWQWDGVRIRVLHPSAWFPYLGNEASCVLRIETAHGNALLTGDIGHFVETKLLRDDPESVRNDVVLVPHHGSAGSSDEVFVAATGARLALVSSGAGNRFGHPRKDVVQRWCHAGVEVVDTAQAGAIRVWLGEKGLQVQERRAAHPRLWDAARRRNGTAGLCYAPEMQRP
ncbi:DNA internalization-related competence protein ComEC/Rec2 [Thermomonas carbonis]|uniref:DNA internalization-related competence protein ComEC/Rec2 n=1 Tax=Thermomonas carbonis TaxID=1463158 RepID=A0A7G9SN08_9GAMM|nr:DNA internalization-related competence protein ComEC/Rec2 [Thermomonas carbonis]QNN69233.1 DNA internalization-related competence protein ComEC/Rec2 [Thermomonas carbonis]